MYVQDLTADESRLESMWYLRNKRHVEENLFYPVECRAIKVLIELYRSNMSVVNIPVESKSDCAKKVPCSVCGNLTFSTTGLCGSHRPNAGQFKRK